MSVVFTSGKDAGSVVVEAEGFVPSSSSFGVLAVGGADEGRVEAEAAVAGAPVGAAVGAAVVAEVVVLGAEDSF